jgi:hypothetical protein
MSRIHALLAFALVAAPAAAQAQFVTSPPPGVFTQTLDFSSISNCDYFGAGPVALPNGVTYTSSIGWSVVGYNCGYGLDQNGSWSSFPHAGLNSSSGWMRFNFSSPVSAVAAFMNYAPCCTGSGGVFIRALDQNNNVLDSYDVKALAPINTPWATNQGDFRGIVRNTNDIYALELADGYVVAHDLYWGNTSVTPEPASMVLFGTGLAGLGAVVRRRRRTQTA